MTWNQIEAGNIGDLPLDLYEKSGEFMIRVDGYELMNGFCHESEVALADITHEKISGTGGDKRILIAGLGLGYTLASFVRRFPESHLQVIEKSSDVLAWFKKYFKHKVLKADEDLRVAYREADIQDELRSSREIYDAIVFDVDNGPEAVSSKSNSVLYTEAGLRLVTERLRAGGYFLLWSAFESPEFIKTAEQVGFSVDCVPMDLREIDYRHYIFVCQKSH